MRWGATFAIPTTTAIRFDTSVIGMVCKGGIIFCSLSLSLIVGLDTHDARSHIVPTFALIAFRKMQ